MSVNFDVDGNHAVSIYGAAPVAAAPAAPQPAPGAAYSAPAAALRQLPGMLFSLQPYEEILSEARGSYLTWTGFVRDRTLGTTHWLIQSSSTFFGFNKDEMYIPLENIDSV